jgi:hypothetical protein
VPPANRLYAQELARHVDAFFPSMYTFDDNQGAWARRAQSEAAEDRALAAGKPVFFYLWPQYHDGTPSSFNTATLPIGNSSSPQPIAMPMALCCGPEPVFLG